MPQVALFDGDLETPQLSTSYLRKLNDRPIPELRWLVTVATGLGATGACESRFSAR